MKYTGNINSYSFVMKEGENVIEVWSDMGEEFPDAYIHLKEGEIRNEKDFHFEIADYYSKMLSDGFKN
jgi:hypothetical protein